MSANPSIIAGVIGWPIAHSRSPLIHGHWLQQHRISGVYIPLPVRPEDASAAIRALPKLGFAGVNATLPHKIIALDVADEVDALARRIGAANTLIIRDGAILATNTDAEGFMENLRVTASAALRSRFARGSQGAGHAGFLLNAPEFTAGSGPAVVLGAGGAARAVLVALLDGGAPEIRLVNRTRGRAQDLAAELGGGRVTVVDWTERSEALAGAALLVNTTSMGMHGQEPLEIVLDDLPAESVVNDIVYAPLETGLLAAARARGNIVVDGLGMLLHQAVPGFEAWFGVRPAVTEELRGIVVQDLGGK